MHGKINTGFVVARSTVRRRLSLMPALIFAIISALAGAIIIASAHLARNR